MHEHRRCIAVGQHRSEYPEPITLSKGDRIAIGELHQGPEGWDNWYFCTVPGHAGGWVPGQIIEREDETDEGIVRENYTARELDVDAGDVLLAAGNMNGWTWCTRPSDDCSGWVPDALLGTP